MYWTKHRDSMLYSTKELKLNKEISKIIIVSNFLQDGYPKLKDYFPKFYRIFSTIKTHLLCHERHFTRFPWETHEKAILRSKEYSKKLWKKSIDKSISNEKAAQLIARKLHLDEDEFSHRTNKRVTSFSPLDVFKIGIGYSHTSHANDSPSSKEFEKIKQKSYKTLKKWAEIRNLL